MVNGLSFSMAGVLIAAMLVVALIRVEWIEV
jgi:hypothetical protein